jgi:hypothetical protein
LFATQQALVFYTTSAPQVQQQVLHAQAHSCSVPTLVQAALIDPNPQGSIDNTERGFGPFLVEFTWIFCHTLNTT